MKTVTALRAAGPGRVHVELDGERWRTIPLEAAVTARLTEGVSLDRERARALARELRRLTALHAAARALRHRDRSVAELDERLGRHGVADADRARTLDTLQRAGLVDDGRFARGRAHALAARGSGDALIRDDLERRGLAAETIEASLAALEPELARIERIVAKRGRTVKTARHLAARGFDEDAVASAVAPDRAGEVE
jgi:SOS response regulatory protein OraA/RecX